MKVPWFRHRFLLRRLFDRTFLDLPDAAIRRVSGRKHWPPYSLRAFVGGAQKFDKAGQWFLEELSRLRLFVPRTRVLDIGCGSGRIAYALATDGRLTDLQISYTGMDIDRASIDWCRQNITPLNRRFVFYHSDCYNPSYNPKGATTAGSYCFPHVDSSFDLILLTSVFTHLLEDELLHYLSEVSRLLAPGGIAYASFFLYTSAAEAIAGVDRHSISFPFVYQHHAVNRQDYPTNAVAYQEEFVRRAAGGFGLTVMEPAYYGVQDILLFTKVPDLTQSELLEGWHELENDRWRWTARMFHIRLSTPALERFTLRFRFHLPQVIVQANGPVRLSANVQGVPLSSSAFTAGGEHLYVEEFSIPAHNGSLTIQFELDKAYGPSPDDARELGLQVAFHSPPGPLSRSLQPFLIAGRNES